MVLNQTGLRNFLANILVKLVAIFRFLHNSKKDITELVSQLIFETSTINVFGSVLKTV